MIRVPLGELRKAFADPAKYAKDFKPGKSAGGPNKYGMFLHSVGEFHRTNDVRKAQDYLEEKLEKNFKNIPELPDYLRKLQVYAKEFHRLGNSFVRVRDNMSIPTPPQFAEFVVSGQASRIDLINSGGYGVWVFVRDVPDWKKDPRMPLLQLAYAQRLGVALDKVMVGVYDFEVGRHSSVNFTAAEISKARKDLKTLLQALKARGFKP